MDTIRNVTINISRVCRFCADMNTKLHPIFENKFDEKILSFVPIKVLKDDGLPSMICALCKYKLNTAYEFRLLAISVDRKLRELLINEDLERTETEELSCESNSKKKKTEKCTSESDTNDIPIVDDENDISNESRELCKITKTELEVNDIQNIVDERLKEEVVNFDNDRKVKRKQSKIKNQEIVVCPECGRSVKKYCLKDHIKTHTGIGEYKCDICGLMLLTRGRLWQHKKYVHTKYDPIKCDQCGKSFYKTVCFKRHYATVHLKIKNFTCNICNRSFAHSKTLKAHMQTHTGERPYICQHCGKAMSSPYALKQHIRLHTNEKPFKCDQCGECFTQNVTLKLHFKRQHMGITPEQERLAKADDSSS